MRRDISINHEFVEFIPSDLKDGTIYVSIRFKTAVHKCFCGCEQEVVTPISPTDWKLIFDGKTISLYPSIGNWSFHCQSHYWIKCNKVIWARSWSKDEINAGRIHDRISKEKYFNTTNTADDLTPREAVKPKVTFWQKIKKWWI